MSDHLTAVYSPTGHLIHIQHQRHNRKEQRQQPSAHHIGALEVRVRAVGDEQENIQRNDEPPGNHHNAKVLDGDRCGYWGREFETKKKTEIIDHDKKNYASFFLSAKKNERIDHYKKSRSVRDIYLSSDIKTQAYFLNLRRTLSIARARVDNTRQNGEAQTDRGHAEIGGQPRRVLVLELAAGGESETRSGTTQRRRCDTKRTEYTSHEIDARTERARGEVVF